MWEAKIFGQEFYYLFYIFVFYGVFGWIYESCLVSFQRKSLVNRGFLNGPMIPIYGCGDVMTRHHEIDAEALRIAKILSI
jgi:uncharacterized membrane protein